MSSTRKIQFALVLAVVCFGIAEIGAQQGPARGPVESRRDPEKEVFAKHNLEVARFYITRRKAYQGALDRLKEVVETHPDFSRMDEVIYWIAEANLKLDKLDVAVDYYEKLLRDYPGSEFEKKVKTRLEELKSAGKDRTN